MKSIFFLIYLASFAYQCKPPNLYNAGDTRSKAFLERALWNEYIRPKSVCDVSTFKYAPTFVSAAGTSSFSPVQLLQAADRSLYVFGVSTFNPEKNIVNFSGTQGITASANATLMKFTQTGEVIWSRTLGLATSSGNSNGMIESPTGGVYLVTSPTESVGSPLNALAGAGTVANVGIFHISSDGNILWNTYYGKTGQPNKGYAIAKLSNGDLVIGGETNNTGFTGFSGSISVLYAVQPQFSQFVMRIKSDGSPVWVHFFGGTSVSANHATFRIGVSSDNTIWAFGFDTEPFHSNANKVVNNHTGTAPRKEYVVTQFDENGTYLRHSFLQSGTGQGSPFLPTPLEAPDIKNEFLYGGVTLAEFQGLSSVRSRNYQGLGDQFIVRFNATLTPTMVTYLGGPKDDPGSLYTIFQDSKKDGFYTFAPFLDDPTYGPGFNANGKAQSGLIRVTASGNVVSYGYREDPEISVPLASLATCDGGLLIAYYVGDNIDSSSSSFSKFILRKVRPPIPINHDYSTPFGTIFGP